jgi:hypothetical protein
MMGVNKPNYSAVSLFDRQLGRLAARPRRCISLGRTRLTTCFCSRSYSPAALQPKLEIDCGDFSPIVGGCSIQKPAIDQKNKAALQPSATSTCLLNTCTDSIASNSTARCSDARHARKLDPRAHRQK